MRLWSLSPSYLDNIGLIALWRETLLAQKVLMNNTKGYKYHPQLDRFKACKDPINAIGQYLYWIYREAEFRGYKFDLSKIVKYGYDKIDITVNDKQLEYEFYHLQNKLSIRDKTKYDQNYDRNHIRQNNMFVVVPGAIEKWEKVKYD